MRVLLVDIDSLRPDHLGCYGYDRDTSPHIDAVADDGVRFENCYVSDSPCLPSRTALATCRHGIDTGVVTHFGEGQWYDNPGSGHDPDADRVRSFQQLAQHGVYTASVSSFTQRHMAYHFSSAFQQAIQPTAQTGELAIEDAEDVTNAATTWLSSHATDDDWLLHVNYWDVHHPYTGIDDTIETVRESGPAAEWPDRAAIEDHQSTTGPRTASMWPTPAQYDDDGEYDPDYADWPMPERYETREDVEHLVDGYDASIRKVDDHVARLLAKLESEGVREDTVVVITGDHGEALGEHGIYAEHALPHPACQRVPMVVSWPDVTTDAGTTVEDFVYQFDLMPTVCDLFDVPVPAGWDARSFADGLRGDAFDGRESLVCGHGIYTFGRALYRDGWVYVRLLHPGVFSLPGLYNDPESLPNRGLELLHDLDADPHQTENLIAERSDVADELRAELNAWLADRVTDDWIQKRPPEARGTDTLARMCTEGPFLYVNPDALVERYRDLDYDEEQIAAVERSLTEFGVR